MQQQLQVTHGETSERQSQLHRALSDVVKLRARIKKIGKQSLAIGVSRIESTAAQQQLSMIQSYVPRQVFVKDWDAATVLVLTQRIFGFTKLLTWFLAGTKHPSCCFSLVCCLLFASHCLV